MGKAESAGRCCVKFHDNGSSFKVAPGYVVGQDAEAPFVICEAMSANRAGAIIGRLRRRRRSMPCVCNIEGKRV